MNDYILAYALSFSFAILMQWFSIASSTAVPHKDIDTITFSTDGIEMHEDVGQEAIYSNSSVTFFEVAYFSHFQIPKTVVDDPIKFPVVGRILDVMLHLVADLNPDLLPYMKILGVDSHVSTTKKAKSKPKWVAIKDSFAEEQPKKRKATDTTLNIEEEEEERVEFVDIDFNSEEEDVEDHAIMSGKQYKILHSKINMIFQFLNGNPVYKYDITNVKNVACERHELTEKVLQSSIESMEFKFKGLHDFIVKEVTKIDGFCTRIKKNVYVLLSTTCNLIEDIYAFNVEYK
ncbi:unnamed protein product [Lactuca saligna]|uniref:Uncharacterized protein n=1 Tax=Lactuca saligna TaxID=75948 RepID=A0AA36EBG0_LACSI|nr:unnamed protein product [Lactuca saligna]